MARNVCCRCFRGSSRVVCRECSDLLVFERKKIISVVIPPDPREKVRERVRARLALQKQLT